MNNKFFGFFLILILTVSLSATANAAFINRGGGMIYDEALDRTWLQDLNFAVYNISELFGYIATGRVNIRICREDGPPKRPAGK